MKSDLAKWIEEDGKKFLRKIGIREGQMILDFGCGKGHYTIPASNLVGVKGKVYALDKNRSVLNKLRRMIEKTDIKNIKLINGERNITVKNNSVNAVLCYDVLHYLKFQDRMTVYNDTWRVLKEEALFSVYPKHNKEDSPSGELADVNLEGIIGEVENSGFILNQKIFKKLLHDNFFNEGFLLNFRKGG